MQVDAETDLSDRLAHIASLAAYICQSMFVQSSPNSLTFPSCSLSRSLVLGARTLGFVRGIKEGCPQEN